MKTLTLSLFFLLALVACKGEQSASIEVKNENTPQFLGVDNIPNQDFLISSDSDTVLIGKHGTKIKIEGGIFVDSTGNEIHGEIKIELKECLDKYSIVLGGLTTTSNDEILESGGMICINANVDNQKLSLKNNSSIQIEIPTDSIIDGMQYFQGAKSGDKINWVNPTPLVNTKSQKVVQDDPDSTQIRYITDTIHKRHNVSYNVDVNGKKVAGDDIPAGLTDKIHQLIFAGNGLVISKDSSVIIEGYKVNLYKNNEFNTWKEYEYGEKWVSTSSVNTFREDSNNSYVFKMKKLGWANIDRFFIDPRTKEIEWLASINECEKYSRPYVSLVFENQKIYLPGYVKDNGEFSFTHGDYEKTALPVGEWATILVTAYIDETPYYAIKKIKIMEKQSIKLDLAETTVDSLIRKLKEQI
ncbi:MAG: hypothetical protein N4A41_05780 [Crocinitomicaceae bacterium]|jgi:hypothetical protein|nr:hypothetical protein [Crocinitomicaceae bacterium]